MKEDLEAWHKEERKRMRTPQKEREAYCKQHGHSWIQVSYSSQRRCSWCEVYEEDKKES